MKRVKLYPTVYSFNHAFKCIYTLIDFKNRCKLEHIYSEQGDFFLNPKMNVLGILILWSKKPLILCVPHLFYETYNKSDALYKTS